ncbi:protein rarD [Dietzia sp. UCD-THP]|uniref:EamA family transporter RarD n=1 Tax=Dietzia sp. UCD-THP TaxID=1292020 RepID=UPI0003818E51|nr:EamA family transporter RarD [Dietzia sp. UCD-THP]EYT64344.1 protein rarD [Dietzia sp. UCD-THP]
MAPVSERGGATGGQDSADRSVALGMLAGVCAYTLWGFFPAFFPLLEPAGAVEIVGHRVVWSLVIMALVLTVTRRWRQLWALDRLSWARITGAAAFITVNWGVYVHTVNSERVTEAALGYTINPLVSVLLGVLIFRERLNRPQVVAVALAVVAVGVLTVGYGHVPYLSLLLATSFGFYGVFKKKLRADPVVGMTGEVLVIGPLALSVLVWLGVTGAGTLTGHGVGHSALLAASGVVTVVPLLLFATAAQRIPLATVGMLQYIIPILQMAWGLLVVGERLDAVQWTGFALIWTAVIAFTLAGRTPRSVRAGVSGRVGAPTYTGPDKP